MIWSIINISCLILVGISVIGLAGMGLLELILFLSENCYVRSKRITYVKLVHETMYYTGALLHEHKIKRYPCVDIRYYKNLKWSGIQMRNTIRVYIKSHGRDVDIVSTVLHEMGHYFDMHVNPSEYAKYSEYTNRYGYWDNPREVFAREFEKRHLKGCLEYLVGKGVMERKQIGSEKS